MHKPILTLLICILCLTVSQAQKKLPKNKLLIKQSVEKHQTNLIEISDAIWASAETAFEEHNSSKLLADYAEKNGFTVERGVAGMPTAFVATFGSGRPIISVLGEFDALPGISQKAQPTKEAIEDGSPWNTLRRKIFR